MKRVWTARPALPSASRSAPYAHSSPEQLHPLPFIPPPRFAPRFFWSPRNLSTLYGGKAGLGQDIKLHQRLYCLHHLMHVSVGSWACVVSIRSGACCHPQLHCPPHTHTPALSTRLPSCSPDRTSARCCPPVASPPRKVFISLEFVSRCASGQMYCFDSIWGMLPPTTIIPPPVRAICQHLPSQSRDYPLAR